MPKLWASQTPGYSPRSLDLLPPSPDDLQFSLGMGVHSVALLCAMLLGVIKWTFDPRRLVVVIAQTGDEFRDTKHLIETYLFPFLRERNVRVVQVARRGLYVRDGITVLDDTRAPTTLYIEGDYKLSRELTEAGTVPQVASGRHICAQKYKGFVIDGWVEMWHSNVDGTLIPYRNILGYHADARDAARALKAQSYTNRIMAHEFPLIEAGWGDQMCLDFLLNLFGVVWKKSCCTFCPFTGGRAHVLERYVTQPDAGVETLLMEYGSMALNGNMTLFGRGKSMQLTMMTAVHDYPELQQVLDQYEQRKREIVWSVYQVQRIYYPTKEGSRPVTDRNVVCLHTSDYLGAAEYLKHLGEITEVNGISRVNVRSRRRDVREGIEEFYVAAPAQIVEKCKPRFAHEWSRQLNLQQMGL